MPKKKLKRIGVYWTEDELNSLKVLASGSGLSVSGFVRKVVDGLIDKNRKYIDYLGKSPEIEL